MKNSKTIELLRSLTPEEMKLLGKFIASPFHNSVKNYSELYNILMKYYPDFDKTELTNEFVFKKLYSDKPFKRQTLWNLISGFEKLTEDFLVQLQMNESIEKEVFLTRQFLKRKLNRFYSRQSERMNSFFGKNKTGRDLFNYKIISENMLLDYNLLEDNQHLLTENVKYKGEYLILKFMLDISEVVNDLGVNYDMYNSEFRTSLPYIFISELRLKEIAEQARQNKFEYLYIIEICYHWIMMIIEPDNETHFLNLRKAYNSSEKRLSTFEKYSINSAMISYCIRMNRAGSKNYRKLVFELDNHRLSEGLVFYPEGQLPKNIYKQIVINAIMLKEYKWVEDFLKTYTQRLKPDFQEPMYNLCSSFLHFELKNYDLVLKSLSRIESLDIRDKTLAKINIAKTYYEIKDTEALLHHIDTSKHFLKNNISVNAERKSGYSKFFRILNNLVRISEGGDMTDLQILKKRILEDKYIPGKKWLLEKTDELINRKF